MAGEVVNLSVVLLSKFGHGRQEHAPKTATSHIRETLPATLKQRNKMKQENIKLNQWEIFSPYFKQIEVPAKTILLHEGKVSKMMYFIEKGCLRTWINNDGKEITTQFFFEGQSVSSIESFRTNQPSLYNIESLEPCVLQTISQKDFKTAVENKPGIQAVV